MFAVGKRDSDRSPGPFTRRRLPVKKLRSRRRRETSRSASSQFILAGFPEPMLNSAYSDLFFLG